MADDEHEHVWGKWFPWSRTEVWRQCRLCNAKQIKEVRA